MIEIRSKDKLNYLSRFPYHREVIAIEAALRGNSKGRLFADIPSDPNVLILWNEFDGFYLSMRSEKYVQTAREILQKILSQNDLPSNEFVIYLDPDYDKWLGKIIPAAEWEQLDVLFYTCESLGSVELKTSTPKIFNINHSNLHEWKGHEILLDTIDSTWSSREHFFDLGMGVAALSQDQSLLGYCLSEHVTEASLEFSIEVDESAQGKGLGTALGNAMMTHCQENHLNPCWYCTSDNIASMRLAERLGLSLALNFHVWYFEWSPTK